MRRPLFVAVFVVGLSVTALSLTACSAPTQRSRTPADEHAPGTSQEDAPGLSGATKSANQNAKARGATENPLLEICSFNIQFLGSFKKRDHAALASVLESCDVAVIQELVTPPDAVVLPDETLGPDREARAFFDAMAALGFSWRLSEEDTGTNDTIHSNATGTEWWVAFYRADRVRISAALPTGFLAEDRSNHPRYERVPYAFAFETLDGNLDFVLISLHLKPGGGRASVARRAEEMAAVGEWIAAHDDTEKDFFPLGDCNFSSRKELNDLEGYLSLNAGLLRTNTARQPRPYDHVFYNPQFSPEVDVQRGMVVTDLVDAMRPFWSSSDTYPGQPYNHRLFRLYYSDHHPIRFWLHVPPTDDD